MFIYGKVSVNDKAEVHDTIINIRIHFSVTIDIALTVILLISIFWRNSTQIQQIHIPGI